jgi:hydroxyacyl-ACP dehydratase HTD2-like protein with hotdog domain
MLARKLRPLFSTLAYDREESLEAALRPYLPPTNSNRRTGSVLPLGHHLIFFNPLVPADQLLPDGTDAIHSPGAPFMRRMWAGGKLSVNPTSYFAGSTAWLMNRPFVCSERIKDVQLRGQDAAEKVFVTIDRRFDSMDSFGYPSGVSSVMDNVSWESATALGDASLVEERNLVFMKDRTSAELSAFQSGAYQPVRYLKGMFLLVPVTAAANKL